MKSEKKAIYIKVDGMQKEVTPKNGKYFTYDEMQCFVGYMVEIVPLPSGKLMVLHEEGKLIGLLKNEKATDIWNKEYPIEKYPNNNDQLVVGDVLIADEGLIR